MSARPETLYQCDRCHTEMHVISNTTLPENKRMSGPEGWLMLRIGDDPSTPPSHFCQQCANEFHEFIKD